MKKVSKKQSRRKPVKKTTKKKGIEGVFEVKLSDEEKAIALLRARYVLLNKLEQVTGELNKLSKKLAKNHYALVMQREGEFLDNFEVCDGTTKQYGTIIK